MQLSTILKIITTSFGSWGFAKFFYEIRTGIKLRLREDYKFSRDFLKERQENPNLHPFVVEKGYQAIAGSRRVDPEEIAYILSLKNPSQCLNDYLKGKKYLNKLDVRNDLKFNFKKKYSTSWSRRWRKSLYFILYFIFFFIALILLFFNQSFSFKIIAIALCFPLAIWYLEQAGRISDAERLVKNQQKHLSTIHLSLNNSYTRK